MKLKDYLMLKQASNTPPTPGPIQPNVVNGKLPYTFSRYLGLTNAGLGGGTLSYASPKLRRMQALMRSNTAALTANPIQATLVTPTMGIPQTHTDTLLRKLTELRSRKATSKRQKLRNERKRENAVEYLEDTDRQAYLKYMFGPDYFDR